MFTQTILDNSLPEEVASFIFYANLYIQYFLWTSDFKHCSLYHHMQFGEESMYLIDIKIFYLSLYVQEQGNVFCVFKYKVNRLVLNVSL